MKKPTGLRGLFTMGMAFIIVIAFGAAQRADAHYLWFDPPGVVNVGDTVGVRLHFGEYNEHLMEIKGGRLDDRKRTTMRLVTPSGDSRPLDMTEEYDHFRAVLSVATPGFYDLTATDISNPVMDWSKHGIGIVRPMFYTRTRFLAYRSNGVSDGAKMPSPMLDLDIIPVTRHLDPRGGVFGPGVGEEVVYRVLFHGEPLTEKADIHIYAPNGWLWPASMDKDGISRFTPLWSGTYVVEVIYLEKKPGEFGGKPYEAIRHRATYSLMVR